MIKSLKKLGIQGTCVNLIKGLYNKPVSLPNRDKLKFYLIFFKIVNEAKVPILTVLMQFSIRIQIVLEIFTRALRQENGKKGIKQISKERHKLSLFAHNMIL